MKRLKLIGYALSHVFVAAIWGKAHWSFCAMCWEKCDHDGNRWDKVVAALDAVFGKGHCARSWMYCLALRAGVDEGAYAWD